MKTIEVEVINRLGLHARPAAKLTQKAVSYTYLTLPTI